MGIKDLILQKGWAGRTISRPETVERFNPIIRIMSELMYAYTASSDRVSATTGPDWNAALKTLRADIGKMSEVVFSNGGVAFSGTELETRDFDFGDAWAERLASREADLARALKEELDIEHQMRSRAILGVVSANHEERVRLLRSLGAVAPFGGLFFIVSWLFLARAIIGMRRVD